MYKQQKSFCFSSFLIYFWYYSAHCSLHSQKLFIRFNFLDEMNQQSEQSRSSDSFFTLFTLLGVEECVIDSFLIIRKNEKFEIESSSIRDLFFIFHSPFHPGINIMINKTVFVSSSWSTPETQDVIILFKKLKKCEEFYRIQQPLVDDWRKNKFIEAHHIIQQRIETRYDIDRICNHVEVMSEVWRLNRTVLKVTMTDNRAHPAHITIFSSFKSDS